MNTEQLAHVLRAVDDATGKTHQFLLIGSQAILAHIDPEWFPEISNPDALFVSQEIDVAILDGDKKTQTRLSNEIAKTFGELSQFDQTFGYCADGVDVETATLATGWRERLVPYSPEGVRDNTFWALSYEDLLISKLMAGRPKDLTFVAAMVGAIPTHPGLARVAGLIASLDPTHDAMKPLALARWQAICESAKPATGPKP